MKQIEKIKEKAVPILKKAGVTRSAVFGSYIRNEQRKDSDIDMLIDFPKGKSLFDFIGLQFELEEVLGKKVDLGEFSTIKPRLKESILKDSIQIL